MRRATTLPTEFEDLLTPAGRRVLAGRSHAGLLAEQRFAAFTGLIDARRAAVARNIIDGALWRALRPLTHPIPDWTIDRQRRNGEELLPKVLRCRTAMLGRRDAAAYRIAERIGLVQLLRSPSFAAFARVLAGRPLSPQWGIQTVCYSAGDYAGPHNDHFPEERAARQGYLDVHLTLSTEAVERQTLVYATNGHFSQQQELQALGTLSAYHLPLWHYTTPLLAKRGHDAEARRWVLMGTFLFANNGR